jgi:hypothetical protein
MPARISELNPKSQVNLDSVFPDLRQKYSEDPVYVETELFNAWKAVHGSEMRTELEAILKYFLEERGPSMSIEGDGLPAGEKIEFFIDDSHDENDQRFQMFMLRKARS